MKKVLTMVTAIILTASLSAFAAGNEKPVNKQAMYELAFTKLQVQDGIDIMLVESDSKAIEFKGADADVDKVEWTIKNGVMKISSKKGSLKGKVQLIVNVNSLGELYVKDGSEVHSRGRLSSSSLKIYLDGDASISIKSTGDIRVIKIGDTDLEIKTATERVFFG
ncbi:MAG TPA: DUF2807 domain-containing protein [Ferruginibacter sp.]|nr:DUF2807 domain-containing protein [Ferruginibacter sp.]HPH89830.1 DUF2807 domain-containing protein [Ferruginibacter sp.]